MMLRVGWVGLLGLAVAGGGAGCAGEVQADVKVVAPKPLEAAVVLDGDKDGVVDSADRCPAEKEDGLPPQPDDGCKLPDPDGDGVVGAADTCPDKPETKNEYRDDDGCPDEPPDVYLAGDAVKVKQPIAFGMLGSVASASKPTVKAIAETLAKHPQVELLAVAVQVVGAASASVDLDKSKERASKLVDALVAAGAKRSRLRASGHGSKCWSAKPGDGRLHVRVELKVVKRAGKMTGVDVGCSDDNYGD